MELPHIPADVPFTGEQRPGWQGFLAGLKHRIGLPSEPAQPPLPLLPDFRRHDRRGRTCYTAGRRPAAAEAGPRPLLIVYGTQTGNAEYVAEQIRNRRSRARLRSRNQGHGRHGPDTLAAAGHLVIVCSTYGEG